MDRREGLFPIYTDGGKNRVMMVLPAPNPDTGVSAEAIHLSYLRTGLGSNPVGLDRGRGGDTASIRFEILGDKVFLVAQNTLSRQQVTTRRNAWQRRSPLLDR